MSEQIQGYTRISKYDVNGYLVHVYEWDSPASAFEPKHAVSVELHKNQDINLAIKTFTEDLHASMSLMEDRILTGDDVFDKKILIYGENGQKALPVFNEPIKARIMEDTHLRMDINPEVIVVRRFGHAEGDKHLQNDIDLALSIAEKVDKITEASAEACN